MLLHAIAVHRSEWSNISGNLKFGQAPNLKSANRTQNKEKKANAVQDGSHFHGFAQTT